MHPRLGQSLQGRVGTYSTVLQAVRVVRYSALAQYGSALGTLSCVRVPRCSSVVMVATRAQKHTNSARRTHSGRWAHGQGRRHASTERALAVGREHKCIARITQLTHSSKAPRPVPAAYAAQEHSACEQWRVRPAEQPRCMRYVRENLADWTAGANKDSTCKQAVLPIGQASKQH